MANSLNAIADLLVPEEQRQKIDKKVDDEADAEFTKQLELALKLSLEPDPDPRKTSNAPSPSNKAKNRKFKKMRDVVPQQNLANSQHNVQNGSSGRMFKTNNLSELSFEEQLDLVQARSKFDAVDILSSGSSTTSSDDLLEIALQKSRDPSEQIDEENRLLLKALEESKLESEEASNAFFDSDASSSTSTSTASYKTMPDVRSLKELDHRRKADISAARKRGGGGTNRPLTDHTNYFENRLSESEDDEEIKLAIQLSLGHNPKAASQNSKNSYLAAARKSTPLTVKSMTSLVNPIAGRNVFADPFKIVSAPPTSSRACPGMRRRPIIVDGCNVAFQHGKNDRYSAKGLLIVYQYFVSRYGYTNEEITIINKYSKHMADEDKEIVESLYKIDVLVYSPSRMVGGRLICSDDDLFVLNMAKEKNGVVVSLDQFRDAYSNTRDKEIKDVIKYRLLQFVFKGDEIIFPRDPLGPNGPSLEDFLKY